MAGDAFDEWRRRRRAGDPSATVINLYEMVARRRGLKAHELPAEERTVLSTRALYEMHPGFEVTPESGRGIEIIEVVPYDPDWPRRFREWRQQLATVLGSNAQRIDHVGSTAVPGLAAKPLVDVQVSVADIRVETAYVPAIESIGVQLRSRDDEERFFRPFAGHPRDVHVHVCEAGSVWERRHLLFVAFLREDEAAREEYARAKQAAVARWADDRIAYTEAKEEVIARITARAESWAGKSGWKP